MVEQALNVLTLHLIWKAKGLLLTADPNAEDNRFKEVLLEQRGSLIDKLKEFAVGNQSNTVEGVKRAVSMNHPVDLYRWTDNVLSGLQTSAEPPHTLCPRSTAIARRFTITIGYCWLDFGRRNPVSMHWIHPSRDRAICRISGRS